MTVREELKKLGFDVVTFEPGMIEIHKEMTVKDR